MNEDAKRKRQMISVRWTLTNGRLSFISFSVLFGWWRYFATWPWRRHHSEWNTNPCFYFVNRRENLYILFLSIIKERRVKQLRSSQTRRRGLTSPLFLAALIVNDHVRAGLDVWFWSSINWSELDSCPPPYCIQPLLLAIIMLDER